MKDILVIFRRNFISPMVIAIYTLAVILLSAGDFRDAWFISVVITLNTAIAIIQEVRAMRALKKLELMSAPLARKILPNGQIQEVKFDQLLVGDIIQLQLGDEVPADGKIITSAGLEADESILTGESAPIEKLKNDVIYAASTIVAGSATMQVTAVDDNTKIGAMASVLKRYEPQLTPLQQSIRRIILWFTYGALGLSALIVIVYSYSGESTVRILKTITSAAVAVVPEGLLLASSLLLAFGAIKLAQAKVLPQKLAAIEAMALLDILCVDKTGTLTSDKITFENVELFDGHDKTITDLVAIIAKETSGGSGTGNAIIAGMPAPEKYEVIQTLAFSSDRKLSGLTVKYRAKKYSILLGAPEFVGLLAPLSDDQYQRVKLLASEGKRVLLFALFSKTKTPLKDLAKNSGQAMGFVILSNELRIGVEKTVEYLQNNGVGIRVISGDNPDTVQYVAKSAGIVNYDKVISGADLQKVADEDWDKVVAETTIFARVLPEQKERLIDTFKRLGNFTGMVGDGINDALALKKADLGVAMYSGAVATRRIADIVLLDNSFNSLPIGMKLGNRIMQAIEILATLFFHKVIYWVILLSVTLAIGLVYPFDPRHITFMNIFLVTLPTIMWTLLPPNPRHRMSPRYFWRNTIKAVAPIAVLSGATVAAVYAWLSVLYNDDINGVFTSTVLVSTFFGVYMVFLSPRMFNIKSTNKTRLAFGLYSAVTATIIAFSFMLPVARDFFGFSTPVGLDSWSLMVVVIIVALIQWSIATSVGKRFNKHKV